MVVKNIIFDCVRAALLIDADYYWFNDKFGSQIRGGINLALKINKFSKKVPNVKSDLRNALKQFLVVVVSTKV